MRRLLIAAVALGSVLSLIAIATAVYGTWTVRRSFPAYDGELAVAGLDANVTVHRDQYGIPRSTPTAPRTSSRRRATCTRRTGSGRWTSVAT